ncbi:MAG: hypothetical protein ACR2NU_00120, partial [Aeoliella sp.]
ADSSDAESDEENQGAADDGGGKADEQANEQAQLEAERERIVSANKTKQEEYQEKLSAGRKRVDELNARFGDWYYVIPNDVFKKIHLGRDDVIEKKETPEGEETATTDDAAPFGTPGSAIPGLPNLGIGGDSAEAAVDAAAEDSAEE